jgi:hypothetical protein
VYFIALFLRPAFVVQIVVHRSVYFQISNFSIPSPPVYLLSSGRDPSFSLRYPPTLIYGYIILSIPDAADPATGNLTLKKAEKRISWRS